MMEEGFALLPDAEDGVDVERMNEVLAEVSVRMRDNYPYQHPLYAGQMLKPPHPVSKAAYMLSLWLNPNNHALDGGKASSQMEKEAVVDLAKMLGYERHLGHLTGGGTMANLEALWVSSRLRPGMRVLASDQAHYTHSRLCEVLGVRFTPVSSDGRCRMDLDALREELTKGDVGTVVATLGTTGTGSLDPLPEILDLSREHGFRVHVDAAYGGYFKLVEGLDRYARGVFDVIAEADSIVIDPHKHGMQPYGCGCILFKDPSVGRFYRHDSPYTYFTSSDLHLGEISLECSRAGAGAVALWATQRMFPLDSGGEFAKNLERCHLAARSLFSRLEGDERFRTIMAPELDIVVWAPMAMSIIETTLLSEKLFEKAERHGLFLAKFRMSSLKLRSLWPDVVIDDDDVTLLRSCLMKPEHLLWMDDIWKKLSMSMDEARHQDRVK